MCYQVNTEICYLLREVSSTNQPKNQHQTSLEQCAETNKHRALHKSEISTKVEFPLISSSGPSIYWTTQNFPRIQLQFSVFPTWLFTSVRYLTTMGIRYSKNAVGNFGRLSCRKMAIGGICSISSVRTVGSGNKSQITLLIMKWSGTLRKKIVAFFFINFFI